MSWRQGIGLGLLSLLVACGPNLRSKNPYERHLALKEVTSVDALMKALRDPDWRLAATACQTAIKRRLHHIATEVAGLLAAKTFTDDRLEYFIQVLGELGLRSQRPTLVAYATHRRPAVRMQVVLALAPTQLGGPGAEPLLVRLLGDKDRRVRRAVMSVLGQYDSKTARIPLAIAKEDWETAVRLGGTRALIAVMEVLPHAKARAIVRAAHGAKVKGRPLLRAVLDNRELEYLHMDAYVNFPQVARGSPIKHFRAETLKRWRVRLDKEIAHCSTKYWNYALSRLRAWVSRPNFDFLQPVIERAKERCRRAALKWVREDVSRP